MSNQQDPNYLSARDMFLMSVLPGIAQAAMNAEQGTPEDRVTTAINLAPEIAACARRIADAVMEERTLRPGGAK